MKELVKRFRFCWFVLRHGTPSMEGPLDPLKPGYIYNMKMTRMSVLGTSEKSLVVRNCLMEGPIFGGVAAEVMAKVT